MAVLEKRVGGDIVSKQTILILDSLDTRLGPAEDGGVSTTYEGQVCPTLLI